MKRKAVPSKRKAVPSKRKAVTRMHTMHQYFKSDSTPSDAGIRSSFENLNMETLEKRIVFVKANAGGGKTHSVIEFIKNHHRMRILVMSHTNASVKVIEDRVKEGLQCVPPNITIQTYDKFAYAHARNVLNPGNIKNIKPTGGDRYTQKILKCVKKTGTTVTECLSRRHATEVLTSFVLNRHVLLEHPVKTNYEIVIVDEAQDMCPLARKFLEMSDFAKYKIFVGDEKQCIYHPDCIFTKNVPDALQFKFTHVFRYGGKELLDWINHNMPIESKHAGGSKCTSISTEIGHEEFSKKYKKHTVVVTQWKYILHYDCANMYIAEEHQKKIRGHVEMHRKYGVKYTEYEALGRSIRDEVSFEEWMTRRGHEYLLEYESPKWVELLVMLDENKKNKPNKKTASTITTVFQMKGLEDENIYVDFSCIPSENSAPTTDTIKDNLFYVAITRPTKNVGLAGPCHPYEPRKKDVKNEDEPKKIHSIIR